MPLMSLAVTERIPSMLIWKVTSKCCLCYVVVCVVFVWFASVVCVECYV